MKLSPLSPDQAVEMAECLANERYPTERQDLRDRLRRWITAMWLRHDTKPVGREYAAACIMCKGTSKAHFCENFSCDKLANHFSKKELCFHPTPHELEEYRKIQADYITLMEKVLSEAIEEQKRSTWRSINRATGKN